MNKNWLILGMLSLAIVPLSAASDRVVSLQEGIELKRIDAYCKEKNYTAVKAQIRAFVERYAHSEHADALYAILGDILFAESDFASALASYNLIKKEQLQLKTEFRRIHCLHQLSQFSTVITATCSYVNQGRASKEELPTLHLQLAHALFRQAIASNDCENKTKYLLLAKEQFEIVGDTAYADQASIPLAHIHAFLKEYPQAVKIYFSLSEKEAANREEYLLQAIQLQLRYDRSAAIKTCEKVYSLGGAHAAQAAFNCLSLLFQEKRYRDVVHFQDSALQYISDEQLPLAYYYIGKSLYHSGDHAHAAKSLEKFLASKSDDHYRIKNALFTELHCAKEIDDFSLFEKTLSKIKVAFPRDEATIQALLLHAQLCHNMGRYADAAENLRELLDDSYELKERGTILYDYALLLSKEKKWYDSAGAFAAFIRQFPEHAQYKNAWHNLIYCRFNAINTASQETIFVKKEEFALNLAQALKQPTLFSQSERQTMHLTLGKMLFDVKKYDYAADELSLYVKEYSQDPHIGDAYVLLALVHYHGTKNSACFAAYAEKALAVQSTMQEAPQLHLMLFNTYLAEAEQASAKREILLKAADHLFTVLDQALKKENHLWLANFYYHQYRESEGQESSLFLERAIAVLEQMLRVSPQDARLAIAADTLEMEGEAIKLAELYAARKTNKERIALLCALKENYDRHPDFSWKYQRLALFDLATAYSEAKEYGKALDTYSFLIDSSTFASSYFALAAQLEKSLLQFSLITPDQKQADAQEVQAICDTLKDLEIKRKLFSEPCHLEAALAYVDIAISLVPVEQQIERRISLLHQMVDNFSSEQYLAPRRDFPDKHRLYQQYMTFVQIDTMLWQAVLASQQHDTDSSVTMSRTAMEQLDLLLPAIVHPRLKVRAENSREALQKLL